MFHLDAHVDVCVLEQIGSIHRNRRHG